MRKRYGRKVDANQKEVRKALEAIGAVVFEIEEPFDLLVWYRRWLVLEVKNEGTHGRRKKTEVKGFELLTDAQVKIFEKIPEYAVSIVWTPEEAIKVVTESYRGEK